MYKKYTEKITILFNILFIILKNKGKIMTVESMSYIIDTLYAIFAMILIIFMVPGFAMLEAGIVRTKMLQLVLTINTLICMAVASIVFFIVWLFTCFWWIR